MSTLNYKIRHIDIYGKDEKIVFDFGDDKELLSVFLLVEVMAFEEWIKSAFDKVLSGESEYERFNGNVCSVEITPTITNICDILAEDDEANASNCEVATREVRELIDEWINKVRGKE